MSFLRRTAAGHSAAFGGKSGAKPSACRFRGIILRPALSGRSKIEPLQPPAPGARAVSRSFPAPNDNADHSRRQRRRIIPAWQKRRQERCGLKARAKARKRPPKKYKESRSCKPRKFLCYIVNTQSSPLERAASKRNPSHSKALSISGSAMRFFRIYRVISPRHIFV